MHLNDFDYDLPPEYIAQTPAEPRDSSRLLVLRRASGQVEHTVFKEIGRYLNPGDVLVLNETRVIPARLYARKEPGGGRAEILLLKKLDEHTWEALAGGKGLLAGRRLQVESGPGVEVVAVLDGPRRQMRFDEPIEPYLARAGNMPLPPYIHTPLADPERYQTVYAQVSGSAAAPTAGLHFTPQLLGRLRSQGIRIARVTLHVGLDTFAPVTEEDPGQHRIHTEWCQITSETAALLNRVRQEGGRIVAVGTTSVRTLETAAKQPMPGSAPIVPFEGQTSLYILPGYQFRAVDVMVTNFHLPKSTLVMMVSAFCGPGLAGRDRLLKTYEIAKNEGYRFYSFGDAMLIL